MISIADIIQQKSEGTYLSRKSKFPSASIGFPVKAHDVVTKEAERNIYFLSLNSMSRKDADSFLDGIKDGVAVVVRNQSTPRDFEALVNPQSIDGLLGGPSGKTQSAASGNSRVQVAHMSHTGDNQVTPTVMGVSTISFPVSPESSLNEGQVSPESTDIAGGLDYKIPEENEVFTRGLYNLGAIHSLSSFGPLGTLNPTLDRPDNGLGPTGLNISVGVAALPHSSQLFLVNEGGPPGTLHFPGLPLSVPRVGSEPASPSVASSGSFPTPQRPAIPTSIRPTSPGLRERLP